MKEIELGTSYLAVCLGLAACPLTVPCSLWTLDPRNEAIVLNFGIVTDLQKEPGCHCNNFCGREIRILSTMQLSVDLPTQKITDSTGNPIVVSAVLTYRFVNTTSALLNVSNAQQYILTQATTVMKQIVSKYTYEELKREGSDVSNELVAALNPKIQIAGAIIFSFNLNELNFAPEIASQMLKKQAATALLDARQIIVKGAVSIACSAVQQFEEAGLKFSEEEKVRLVTNLLIVTAGDKEASPTIAL